MKTRYLTFSDKDLQIAADLLSKDKKIIAFPTETVYGLAISLDCFSWQSLYELKERPKHKPLTVHLSDINLVFQFIETLKDNRFYLLAEKFFPGPLTLILPAKKKLNIPFIKDATIAIRVPSDPVAQKFISYCGGAIFATSANLSGEKAFVSSKEVKAHFDGKIAAVIKEKKKGCARASTVICLTGETRIMREGSICRKEIEKILH